MIIKQFYDKEIDKDKDVKEISIPHCCHGHVTPPKTLVGAFIEGLRKLIFISPPFLNVQIGNMIILLD